ncbi:hypothetical protein TruAng_005781 [Truncatella angustata]|nr:hypothetical protein TruAng_005781 [Truncatella angustata]
MYFMAFINLLVHPVVAAAATTTTTAYRGYPTSGCGSPAPCIPGTFINSTIETNNGSRKFGIWVPENYDYTVETGLIFSYHGANGNISNQRALDQLTNPEFNTDYIVAYLQGVKNSNGSTTWQGAPGAPADDIAFTNTVLDKIQSQFCVDSDHIYATGKSQGAGFVGQQLACNSKLSARFAAFAPVSGAYYNANITEESDCKPESMPVSCSPSRTNIPILAFHGGADSTISYHGGFRKGACLPDIQYWVRQWAQRNGLQAYPSDVHIPGSDGGFTRTYGNGTVMLVYDGDNIPHDWPASFNNSDNAGHHLTSFNATTWILGFFNDHSLRK